MANFNKDIPDLPENTGGASLDGSELFEVKKGTGLGSSQKLTLNNLASKIKDIIASFFATAAQGAKADTAIQSIVAGTNISVDNTDPRNPKITGSGGTVKTVNTVNPDGSGNVAIAAANVPFTPPTGMTSTDVQTAIAEAYSHGGGGGGGTGNGPAANWTNLTLQNGWVNYGTDGSGQWQGGQYVKDGFGIVHLRGLIKNGTTAAGTVIATLPAGYAPPLQIDVPVNVAGAAGTLKILPNGNITTNSVGSNGFVVLDGVQWSTGNSLTSIAGGASSGTYASAPTTPAFVGQVYQCTDCPLTMIGVSSGWSYFHRGELITPPTALTTWVNQGSATEIDTGPFKTINAPALAGDSQKILAKSLANLTNYTVTAKLSLSGPAQQYVQGGLILRNSTSGAAVSIDFTGQSTSGSVGVNQQLVVAKWTNPTTYNGSYYAQACANPGIVWMRFVDDGTNRKAYISFDGIGWMLLASALRTDFVTPDQVGFYASSSGGSPATVTCLSFQETTP